MQNEIKFLLRNIKENIKKLSNENHLIEFLDNYKNNINLLKLNEMVKDEIDLTITGIFKMHLYLIRFKK